MNQIEKCDRCQVRATNIYRKNNQILTFCNHHSNKNEVPLIIKGWTKDRK